MTQPVSRRNALGMFSTTGLGALLASCSSGGEGTASAPMTEATVDETYLRGTQVTNAERVVEFVTIYPGWYSGRTVHIHCKVHLDTTTLLTT
jgi:protocatechuate 3,4-dioxygenase beta subunit